MSTKFEYNLPVSQRLEGVEERVIASKIIVDFLITCQLLFGFVHIFLELFSDYSLIFSDEVIDKTISEDWM